MRVVAIVGTYHRGGMVDTAVDEMLAAAEEVGAHVEKVMLIDCTIAYCNNCQHCAQEKGEERGACVVEDDMLGILDRIDAADGIILASPMNFGVVTAVMKCFIERTLCYTYWPWPALAPALRKKRPSKRAVVVTSSAAPAILGRVFTRIVGLLSGVARLLGAKRVGVLYMGLSRHRPMSAPRPRHLAKARKLGRRLAGE